MTDDSVRAGLASLGLEPSPALLANAPAAVLYEIALARGEGRSSEHGALVVETAPHTGRSPADKFIVKDGTTDATVWWDNNQAMTREDFTRLKDDMFAYARSKRLFAQDLHAGADPEYRLSVRVICELAWHALFIRHMLIVPADRGGFAPGLTVIDLPGFKADPRRHGTRGETAIAIDLAHGLVLIGGTRYAGEMKKAVFSVLNATLPERGVLPMHCSANAARDGGSAIFFGLSGTGKTTLSADPSRMLVGDDEHGWSDRGIFNFEGGCYAKTIRLSKDAEPEIHAATRRFATVLENVAMDPVTRSLDLDDARLTENTRAAYPLAAIPNASTDGRAAIPKTVIMLAADAFGVLPPLSRLNAQQAMYHFLSGYTAKVAGTERGVSKPQAVFSACFGAPFLPRHPSVYGNMLRERIERHGASCYLVNTGWTGGGHGQGARMPIAVTRTLLDAALSGRLDGAPMRTDPYFGFAVPLAVPGVEPRMLDPRAAWADPAAYDAAARRLVAMFVANFAAFEHHVGADVMQASPVPALAAE